MPKSFKTIRDLKPGSVFLVEDSTGKKLVIKKSPLASLIVRFSQLVHQRNETLAEIMPEFTLRDGFLCQEFLTWKTAGDTVKTHGIESNAFKYIDADKLGKGIIELQKLETGNWKLEIRQADFYLKNIDEFKPALIAEFGTDFAQRVEQFLESKKEIIDQKSRFLANGDLHPQNIMYEEGRFKVVDWDLLHFDNPGWDLADLYCWGWRNNDWSNKVIKEFKKTLSIPEEDFNEILAFDIVYLSSQLIKHAKIVNLPKEFLEAQKERLREYLV